MADEKPSINMPKFNSKAIIANLKDFLQQCKRVLMISRKPSREEYLTISKVTGLGICLLGIIGFLIHVPITYLKALIMP